MMTMETRVNLDSLDSLVWVGVEGGCWFRGGWSGVFLWFFCVAFFPLTHLLLVGWDLETEDKRWVVSSESPDGPLGMVWVLKRYRSSCGEDSGRLVFDCEKF